ncbi:MAG: SusD/RagB family nutrient-binding outer membrane lipoprotein [Bacteroidales bacterium]|nr:SusD/RagB family nutrient-binding outer membrane lipoprotein [Bacteroidales bacterium]
MEVKIMKIMKKSIIAALAIAAALTSCDFKDFGDINISPNAPGTPYTDLLFTNACYTTRGFICNTSYDRWIQAWPGYIAEAGNNQFGSLGTSYEFDTRGYYYGSMKILNLIIELNSDEETKSGTNVLSFCTSNDNQIAVALTLRAYIMMHLTDVVGPLPWSEAWKGESDDIWFPVFDSQQDIYTALFNDLEKAYGMFNESSKLSSADVLYSGNIAKWKKLNATIRMDMALRISDVDPATAKTRFAKAYADGGITSNADHFVYKHDTNATTATFYSVGNLNYGSADHAWGPNKLIVDALKEYQDPRMFTYFTIGDDAYLGKRAGDPADFESYIGIQHGMSGNDEVTSQRDVACSITQKYCQQTATYGLFTANRSLLNMAEAVELGLISGDASSLYEQAIAASFAYEGADGAEEYIAAHPLPADKEGALQEIRMQRWLAGFMCDGLEAWADWRRTNVPALELTDFQKLNHVGHTTMPTRMIYSDTDKERNQEQYDAAIAKYFGGKDDRWGRVWWDVTPNE